MHWSLVEFDEPVLATSDHPVVLWPIDEERLRPDSAITAGAHRTLEVKWPLTPSLALLALWRDVGDKRAPVAGTEAFAESLNSLVIAQAEEPWIHLPDTTPPRQPADEPVAP